MPQPLNEFIAIIRPAQGMVHLGFQPQQWSPRIVPLRLFEHDAMKGSVVHPMLEQGDALQITMGFIGLSLQEVLRFLWKDVTATQGQSRGGCGKRWFLNDVVNA